ncbi:MAG: hypothetical protein U0R21_07445 [Nocardioidaceae bacterium]
MDLSDFKATVTQHEIRVAHGHAVTTWLRAAWPEADYDDLEYAALMAAAAESASRMNVISSSHFGHRVVLVVDADVLDESDDSTAVEVATPVAWARLAAVQADPDPIALDDHEDDELGWFANQEAEWLLERIKGDPST